MTRYLLALTVAAGTLTAAPSADPKPWSAAEDAKALEGRWQLAGSRAGGATAPAFLTAQTKGAVLRFEKGALAFEGSAPTATFVNDPKLVERPALIGADRRLMTITPKGGESFVASYALDGDRLEIRYPAGGCSRSSTILAFERAK